MMNLFRSEEHVRNWALYDSAAVDGTLPLDAWVRVFSVEYCRVRLNLDFFLHAPELRNSILEAIAHEGKGSPFFALP
jgi:hypothetical protein